MQNRIDIIEQFV